MNLVTVATYDTPPRAHLAIGMLSEAGIEGVLRNEHIVAGAWDLGQASQGVEVQVAAADAQRALALIEKAAFQGGVVDDDLPPEFDEADDPSDTPPELRALESSARRALLAAVFAVAFPPLALYSLWTVFGSRSRSGVPPATPLIRRQLFTAFVLDLLVIVFYGTLPFLVARG